MNALLTGFVFIWSALLLGGNFNWLIYYSLLVICTPFVLWAVTSLGCIPIPIADQAAKWGWWFFIILYLKSDDSYRVAFEERRFISSRIWRTTIHIESCLESDDFISSRIVSESHLGNSFVRLSFRSYFRADICWGVSKSFSIACLKTLIDSFPIILHWSDLLARRRDHLSWDTSNYLSIDASDHLSRDASNYGSVDASDHDSVDVSDHDSVDASDHDSVDASDRDSFAHSCRNGRRRLLFSARGPQTTMSCNCVPWDTLCFPVLKSFWCCHLNVDWAKRDNARGKAASCLRLRVKRGWRVSESDWRDMYSLFMSWQFYSCSPRGVLIAGSAIEPRLSRDWAQAWSDTNIELGAMGLSFGARLRWLSFGARLKLIFRSEIEIALSR